MTTRGSADAAEIRVMPSAASPMGASRLLFPLPHTLSGAPHAHELRLDEGGTLVWTSGGVLRCAVTLEPGDVITDALFARFHLDCYPLDSTSSATTSSSNTNNKTNNKTNNNSKGIGAEWNSGIDDRHTDALVVAVPGGLRIFCANGERFFVMLPIVLERMMALWPAGLLLAHDMAASFPSRPSTPAALLRTPSPSTPRPLLLHPLDDRPQLFSLMHPLDQPRAVCIARKPSSNNIRSDALASDLPRGSLVYVACCADESPAIVVLFNAESLSLDVFSIHTSEVPVDLRQGRHSPAPAAWRSARLAAGTWTPRQRETPQDVIDERESRSPCHLVRLFALKLPFTGAPSSCFTAHAPNGIRVLWATSKFDCRAVAISLDEPLGNLLGVYDAKSAVPVRCSRPDMIDVLLFNKDNSFSVWTGSQQLLPCVLPETLDRRLGAGTHSSKRPRSSPEPAEITNLPKRTPGRPRRKQHTVDPPQQPQQNSVCRTTIDSIAPSRDGTTSICLSDNRTFVANFAFYAQSTLVRSCIFAIEAVLPREVFEPFHHRFLRSNKSTRLKSSEADSEEWETFCTVIFSFVLDVAASGTRATTRSSKHASAHRSTSEWEWVLANRGKSNMFQQLPRQALRSLKPIPVSIESCWCKKVSELREKASLLDSDHPLHDSCAFFATNVIPALHAVYENVKLAPVFSQRARTLGQLLAFMTALLGWRLYSDHYFRDGIPPPCQRCVSHAPQNESAYPPANVFEWIRDRIVQRNQDLKGPLGHLSEIISSSAAMDRACPKIRIVTRLFNALNAPSLQKPHYQAPTSFSDEGDDVHIQLLDAMCDMGLGLADLDALPIGITFPIREALHTYKSRYSCDKLNVHQLALLGRSDLVERCLGSRANSGAPKFHFSDTSRTPSGISDVFRAVVENKCIDVYRDGFEDDQDIIVKLRWARWDLNIKDIAELFSPSEPPELPMPAHLTMTFDDITVNQQQCLHELSSRVWSLSIGRGMFLLNSQKMLPTETLEMPDVSVSARMPPQGSVIPLQIPPDQLQQHQQQASPSHQQQQHHFYLDSMAASLDWAEFHAGVAAGLQVRKDSAFVDSSWIVFNQLVTGDHMQLTSSHAGMILGLGLNSHMQKINTADALRFYLYANHHMTTIGTLLGIGVSYVGTKHEKANATFNKHIPVMMCSADIKNIVTPWIRAAAVVGAALVNLGMPSLSLTNCLIDELESQQFSQSDPENNCNECYSMSCGIALGLLLLDTDDESERIARSGQYMPTGSKLRLVQRLINVMMNPGVELTAPAATIALALALLKSNNAPLADKIVIPESRYALEFVRPDLLMLRVIARSLIMWNSIRPTRKWIRSCVPVYILQHISRIELAKSFLITQEDLAGKGVPESRNKADDMLVWQAYFSLVPGACLSIALRFAGTCDRTARKVLREFLDECMISATRASAIDAYEEHMHKSAAHAALNVACTAIAVVMAGSGDAELYAIFKTLHDKVSSETNYGCHMAVGMAIGFLFLGRGTLSLGSSNIAVASLLCALYPTYPPKASDNRAHLQALRHLWVLAVEQRCFVTRDVDTRQPVAVPIEVTIDNGTLNYQVFGTMSPCILPEVSSVRSIKVCGPRYWPARLQMRQMDAHVRKRSLKNFWVKRKTGHLEYADDPRGHNSILLTQFPSDSLGLREGDTESVRLMRESWMRSLSADPHVIAFAQHFCDMTAARETTAQQMSRFCAQVLHECLTMDKPEMIQVYLWLHETVRSLERGLSTSHAAWNLALVLAHYDALSEQSVASGVASILMRSQSRDTSRGFAAVAPLSSSTGLPGTKTPVDINNEIEQLEQLELTLVESQESHLIRGTFLNDIKQRIKYWFSHSGDHDVSSTARADMDAYIHDGVIDMQASRASLLGACLVLQQVPAPARLEHARQAITNLFHSSQRGATPRTRNRSRTPDQTRHVLPAHLVSLAQAGVHDCSPDLVDMLMKHI